MYDSVVSLDLSRGDSEIVAKIERGPLMSSTMHAFGDVLMIVGGVYQLSPQHFVHSQDVLLYDLRSRQWAKHGPSLPYALISHCSAASDDDALVVFGGFNPVHRALNQILVLPQTSWSALAEPRHWGLAAQRMAEPRDASSCAFLL